MVGITYAAGYSPDVLIAAYKHDLTPPWLFRQLPRGRNWYLVWQFRTGAWTRSCGGTCGTGLSSGCPSPSTRSPWT